MRQAHSWKRTALLGAIEYMLLLALVAMPLFLLQIYVSRFPSYISAMQVQSVTLPFAPWVSLSYTGFILLALSAIPAVLLARGKLHLLLEGRLRTITVFFAVAYAAMALVSLRYALEVSISTGTGLLPLEVLVGIYTFCIALYLPDTRLVVPVAYALGAITGPLSDVVSSIATFQPGAAWSLGFYGPLDGDVIMAVAFAVTCYAFIRIRRNRALR